ncbi:COX15/CtaA family protein [Novosphingobium colocasiae]
MRSAHAKPIIGTTDDILPMARWLLVVAAMVVLIVAIGGITRLTESGLSITQWKPVTGALPPADRCPVAGRVRRLSAHPPQYIDVNGPAGMTLAQYKFIYFWEWAHRLLGRLIGLAMIGGTAWFWFKRTIPLGYKARLLALIALVGLQGTIGWLMVSSGLSPDALDRVSHYWLAAHLVTALFTLGGLVWTALDLYQLSRGQPRAGLSRFTLVALAMLGFQLFMGALVAGQRAGQVAGAGLVPAGRLAVDAGQLCPRGIEWDKGLAHAMFGDPYLSHFIHRWWAWAVVAVLVVMGRRLKAIHRRDVSVAVHIAFGTQVLLGIATIWSGVSLWLAVAHQLCGALLVVATVWGAHTLSRRG